MNVQLKVNMVLGGEFIKYGSIVPIETLPLRFQRSDYVESTFDTINKVENDEFVSGKGSYIDTLRKVRFLSENRLRKHIGSVKEEIICKKRLEPKFKFPSIRKARKFLEKFKVNDIEKIERIFPEKDRGILRVISSLRRRKINKLFRPRNKPLITVDKVNTRLSSPK